VPSPLDEYPIHQVPLSLRHVATSDRNFYDRCIFQAHDRTGDVFLITGLGVYPNLGVIDAFATVRRGDDQTAVRASDALSDDRLHPSVGPFTLEVVEPLRRIRMVCDADEHGIGFDLTFTGTFPAVDEPQHIQRINDKILLDACRFAQVGAWSGVLRVHGDEFTLGEQWIGTRDRSWGIRPVGDPEPPGRTADEPLEGFWWCWVPLQFDDFSVLVIAQEEPDGHRVLSEAVRVWPEDTGRRSEQLGWPRIDIAYRPGTRHPHAATIHLAQRDGTPVVVEVETVGFLPLHIGAGYGGDPEWSHGQWKGRNWVEGRRYDLTDPAIAGRIPFGVIDHIARATCDGQQGWGIFEHGTFGRHDPSGFADWSSVAAASKEHSL
jgi:hypothetical protein